MPKILIADDNTNIQKMVALAFEERGVQVVAVGNGEAAVRRLSDLDPDIVLADIFMPVRSGYEVCEYIKKDKRFSHVPVILLVGAFDPLDEKEARRVGADGVLKKPFVPPDPLIAMVTSALEKNPRIAAELAKAKEVAAAPPPPPEPQIAAKAAPKPLPEFPEPTPEEAALVYGFGSGRRSILDEEKDREDVEPVEPIGAEAEEELEGAATSRDWRRAAMDFEVPGNMASQPTFAEDVATFPSESDVPPRHVPVRDTEGDLEPVVANRGFDFAPEHPQAPEHKSEPVPVAAAPSAPPLTVSEEVPAVAVAVAPQHEAPPEPEIRPEPAPPSAVPHWMDALSVGPSASGWMAGLSRLWQKRDEVRPSEEVSAPLALRDLPPAPTAGAPNFHTDAVEQTPAAVSQPLVDERHDEKNSADAAEPARESWFAPAPAAFDASQEASREPGADEPVALMPELIAEPADIDVSIKDPNLVEPPAVRVIPEPLLESEDTDVAVPVSQHDPYLEEPAAAVRVIPEPLLLDAGESQPPAHVDSHPEEIAPAYSLVAPEPAPPAAEEVKQADAAQPHDEPPAAAVESFVEEFSERIPTGPPPNREALAEIPFLTPPADFHAGASEEAGLDSETVDAVVRKVLERLEPQLHDLLSQGVLKPLVENLLQGELAKKNR